LRGITLCRWANLLLDKNASDPVALNDIKPILLADLTYVQNNWSAKCTDLWEEVRGNHFYTRLVQRRSLLDGAKLLDRIGDTPNATACRTQVPPLETAIAKHFDATNKLVVVTFDIEGDTKGKTSQLDVAVILAALHGETPTNPFFSPADDRIMATATKLRDRFAGLYAINMNAVDGDGQTMGPAIGRYPEDIYDGASNSVGNPWFLATAAFAEHAYRVRAAYQTAMTITVSDLNLPFLTTARDAGGNSANLAIGDTITPSDPRFAGITNGLQIVGDRYLRRIRLHAADDGSLSEQFKRSNGFMTSAVDLTWSYAALLTAISRR
jgi:glucoamylase